MKTPNSVKCEAKHTKCQPTDDEWKCPKCAATAQSLPNSFIIECEEDGADSECTNLHLGDTLRCGCGYETSGKAFAARVQKAANMVPRPACKGHGLVKGGAT